jgi:hypothetical protein
MVQMVLPIAIEFEDWVAQLNSDLIGYQIPSPVPVDKWREWGASFISGNPTLDIPFPTVLFYKKDEDWRDWAINIVQAVNNY